MLAVAQPRQDEDPEALFQRIRSRLSDHLSQMPNYTCHESIHRMVGVRGSWQFADTVELEVAFVGDQELFSRPGENRFGAQPVEQIVRGGTIGNSVLGSHIDNIFARNEVEFQYAGRGKKDGHHTFRFNLHVPIEKSRFRVRHEGAEGMAGYDGSIWVDAETLDPVRVEFRVNRIPPHVGVRLIEESLHYKNVKIGNSQFALPDHSELAATDDLGNSSLNLVKLDRCREFAADSVVRYGSPSQGSAARESQDH